MRRRPFLVAASATTVGLAGCTTARERLGDVRHSTPERRVDPDWRPGPGTCAEVSGVAGAIVADGTVYTGDPLVAMDADSGAASGSGTEAGTGTTRSELPDSPLRTRRCTRRRRTITSPPCASEQPRPTDITTANRMIRWGSRRLYKRKFVVSTRDVADKVSSVPSCHRFSLHWPTVEWRRACESIGRPVGTAGATRGPVLARHGEIRPRGETSQWPIWQEKRATEAEARFDSRSKRPYPVYSRIRNIQHRLNRITVHELQACSV